MNLIEQFEKGKRLISQGKSLGRDTKALEERVRVLEAQFQEHLNGEPNRNAEQIKVTYRKRSLRIVAPDIGRIFLEIKRQFPKGSIVLHDGAVYIAFYYLPVVLKTLEERFGRIDVDSAIPDFEGVRSFLGMRQVSVDADLIAELENPVTKRLLGLKSAEGVSKITRQLKDELGRSRWVDSVWEEVEKAKGSTEGLNEEEFDMNTKSKVDSKLSETNYLSLINGKKLIQYQVKGGEKKMGYDIAIEEPIEAGACDLTISDAQTIESKFGPALKVTTKSEDGRCLNSLFPLPARLNNKTGQLIKKIFGEFKKINSDELIGKKFRALIEHVQRDGRTYVIVSKIL